MKSLFYTLGSLVVILVVFLFLNSYIFNQKQGDGNEQNLVAYFQDRMVTLGVQDFGAHPIEGFDADLLMSAYPGILPDDFRSVKTFEGYYEIQNGQAVFVRGQGGPVSSAQTTVSEEGYATLLENISARLQFPIYTEEDVDALIEQINTGEHVVAKIGEEASVFGVKITPREVLEDSRCPIDVTCIQAGTVRVRADLESGLGVANQVFELNQPITTEAEEITLVQVMPFTQSEQSIQSSDYAFSFEVKKR